MGFITSKVGPFLFIYHELKGIIYLFFCVDDIIITDDRTKFLPLFINQLSKELAMKYLGHFHYFLGIEATPKSDSLILILSQGKYVL